jgi:hypothetical protein
MKDLVRKKDSQRHALLRAVYEAAKGEVGHDTYETLYACGKKVGLSDEETTSAFDWLCDRGLMERFTSGSFTLTREGVDEMEESLRDPETPTEHFAPSMTLNISGGTIGVIQTGSHNTAHVAQQLNAGATSDVLSLIEQLRQGVRQAPTDKHEEASTLVDAIEEEVKQPSKKSPALVKSYAGTLNQYMLAYAPVLSTIVDYVIAQAK